MIIVDTHCHVSSVWYEPIEVLLHHMDQNNVARAILIQYMGQYNNAYQTECIRRYPDRLASVVLVDAGQADAPEALEKLADEGASGIRLTANTRSSGDDPLAIWRKAESLGLAVSCAGNHQSFTSDDFAASIEAVPNLPIIIEHLGSGNQPDDDVPPYPQHAAIFALSRYANTYIKIHGLGEFCKRNTPVTEPFPFETPIPPLLEMACDAFGPDRVMWGSDYPPVSSREGYRNSLQMTMDQLKARSSEAQAMIFGGTAMKVFWGNEA